MLQALVFILFFLSGAAGLVYEVTWARSLGLVFGASHLAVTTVLAVYMGGQALGSAIFGRMGDRSERPLRMYGWLELGIAVSALGFVGLMRVYPWLYPPVARIAEENGTWLTLVRAAFAVAAMIVPTTLMGGTLPVLTRFVARGGGVGHRLSSLYTVNTLGAVAGTVAAGFLLIPALGVTATLLLAAGVSATVGGGAFLLQARFPAIAAEAPADPGPQGSGGQATEAAGAADVSPERTVLLRAALVGAAVSGFCALGYEVLWTRMLTLVVGTSVYSFSVILVAFLTGIGVGSHAFRWVRSWVGGDRRALRALGLTEILIGLTALGVTLLMGILPSLANHLRGLLEWKGSTEFAGRLAGSFGVAVVFVFVPAFFMGLAFPLAGAVWTARGGRVGAAVGRLLTANTVGAILGSVVSGFFLIRWFGIERSLQMLVVVNVGVGLAIVARAAGRRPLAVLSLCAMAATIVARVAVPEVARFWDRKYFATYVNGGRSTDTPEQARERLADLEVLYFHEGQNETVSVTRGRGGEQSFIVNGRPEASTVPMDVQLQKALGHLPMLLHPNPRSVFVLGTGTGMTLGATAVHPEAERIVLAEIEEGVLGVARTFSRWNGGVLDSPKLRIVFNDGRNFLATTREKFDVITADPIHPWSGGAGYLYTKEYFESVATHLAPEGIAAQWLPLYELTEDDVRTVVRTFAASFPYAMVWLTWYDAVLVGSNEPIRIDEAALARRMESPVIRDDLAVSMMSTPDDLLSFFLLGPSGTVAAGRGGRINDDDNVTLEFSAPTSQGVPGLEARAVAALAASREPLLPYLVPAERPEERRAQVDRWNRMHAAGREFDRLHARFLAGDQQGPDVDRAIREIRALDPRYAPLRFLQGERDFSARLQPIAVASEDFHVKTGAGAPGVVRVTIVRQYAGRGAVLVSVVDNARRRIFGQRYLDGPYEELDAAVRRFASETLEAFRGVAAARRGADGAPPEEGELVAAFAREGLARVGALEGPRRSR